MTTQEPSSEGYWQNYRNVFSKSPISHSLFWVSLFFSLGGFVYNNLQNSNGLFTSAWFFDAFALSWTNLLVIPTFIVTVYWGIAKKDWSDFKEMGSWFFWSPFAWIGGYLILRFIYKSLLLFNELLGQVFNWLGN